MKYSIEHDDNIVIFRLNSPRVDANIASQFKAELLILCQPDIDALFIDLSAVELMDSSGLGALLLAHRQLKEHSIPVVIIGVKDYIRSLMGISQIEHLFDFYESVEEAIDDLFEEE